MSPEGSWAAVGRHAISGCRRASTTPARTWPVLTAEPTPVLDLDTWSFRATGSVEREQRWSWDEIHQLAPSSYDGDIHCVTTWSKLGMHFAGVSVDTLLDVAGVAPDGHPRAGAGRHTRYTTNLPLADVTGGKAWVVWEVDGQAAAPSSTAAGPAPGAAPLLLEERQVGRRACALLDHDEPGLLGAAAATTTGATPGSSSATRVTDR